MALHGLDGEGRVVYVGTFSKSVFPALRLAFLVVPEPLVEAFTRARLHADQHPPILEQHVLAEFLGGGHFARHVRRMRRAYELRRDALVDAVRAEAAGLLDIRAASTGLHLVGHLPPDVDDREVARLALARGVEVAPLSPHYLEPTTRRGLVIGFAGVREEAIRDGVRRLAGAIREARRAGREAFAEQGAA